MAHIQKHRSGCNHHWLPNADQVQFTLFWKAMTGTKLDYVAELSLPVGTQTGQRALCFPHSLYSAFKPPPILIETSRQRCCKSGMLSCPLLTTLIILRAGKNRGF